MVKCTDILIWYDFIEGCVSKELVSRGSLPILCGLFRVTKGVFAKRFGKINKKFCWHWTNNQQSHNWQYIDIDSSRNQTTVLQRIGVRLYRYTTRLVLLGSTNGFYYFALQEKNVCKKAVLKHSNRFKPPTSQEKCEPFWTDACSDFAQQKKTTPLASYMRDRSMANII